MKQQAVQYVGLDVHEATVVASVRNEAGTVVMRASVPTELERSCKWSRAPALGCTWPSRKGPRRNGYTMCSCPTRRR